MNVRSAVYVLAGLCCVTGCTVLGSVAPIVNGASEIYDPRLIGTWIHSESAESAVITRDSALGYEIVYTDGKGKIGRLNGRLGQLGGRLVLDLVLAEMELDVADVYGALLLPLHTPIFIDSIGETLVWRGAESDSINALLTRSPKVVAHEMRDDHIVLTAPSPAVRRFVAGLARRPGFLAEAVSWTRRRPECDTRSDRRSPQTLGAGRQNFGGTRATDHRPRPPQRACPARARSRGLAAA